MSIVLSNYHGIIGKRAKQSVVLLSEGDAMHMM